MIVLEFNQFRSYRTTSNIRVISEKSCPQKCPVRNLLERHRNFIWFISIARNNMGQYLTFWLWRWRRILLQVKLQRYLRNQPVSIRVGSAFLQDESIVFAAQWFFEIKILECNPYISTSRHVNVPWAGNCRRVITSLVSWTLKRASRRIQQTTTRTFSWKYAVRL